MIDNIIKNQIQRNLRLKGLNQSHISGLLNIKQGAVSQKINGKRNWKDWELQELKKEGIIDSI